MYSLPVCLRVRPWPVQYVFALAMSMNGMKLPLLLVPNLPNFVPKYLTHAVVGVTNASGEVVFPDLGFQAQGGAGPTSILFVCDGVFSPPSNTVNVITSVASVNISTVPASMPFASGVCTPLFASPRFAAGGLTALMVCAPVPAADGVIDTIYGNAPMAIIRVLDAYGQGVPGQSPTPIVAVGAPPCPLSGLTGCVCVWGGCVQARRLK